MHSVTTRTSCATRSRTSSEKAWIVPASSSVSGAIIGSESSPELIAVIESFAAAVGATLLARMACRDCERSAVAAAGSKPSPVASQCPQLGARERSVM